MRKAVKRSQGSAPRWLHWLPCILLVVVAVHQIAAARFADLSPWKGGGFGMFSSIDSKSTRLLRVYAVDAEGQRRELDLEQVSRAENRLRNQPSESRALALARLVLRGLDEEERAVVEEIDVELWKLTLDPGTTTYSVDRWWARRLTIGSAPPAVSER